MEQVVISTQKTRESFRVELTNEAMIALMELEPEDSLDFIEDLTELGAENVNYDGHFGAAIYFDMDVEDVFAGNLRKVEGHIEWYLNNELEDRREMNRGENGTEDDRN